MKGMEKRPQTKPGLEQMDLGLKPAIEPSQIPYKKSYAEYTEEEESVLREEVKKYEAKKIARHLWPKWVERFQTLREKFWSTKDDMNPYSGDQSYGNRR